MSTVVADVMDDDGKPVEVTTTTETTTVTTAKPKTATLTRWFKKDGEGGGGCMKNMKPKGDTEDAAAAMSIGINMLDRDERGLNEHVKVIIDGHPNYACIIIIFAAFLRGHLRRAGHDAFMGLRLASHLSHLHLVAMLLLSM